MPTPDDPALTRALAGLMGWRQINEVFGVTVWRTSDARLISSEEWHPLESMDDAWGIVERFIPAQGWTQQQYEERRCFWEEMGRSTYSPLYAWTASRAADIICRAALAAIGVEVPK